MGCANSDLCVGLDCWLVDEDEEVIKELASDVAPSGSPLVIIII